MRIRKAATTFARLPSRVWTNPKLTKKTKLVVYNACVFSTLMYGSETWTTCLTGENTQLLPPEKYPGKTECPTPMSCIEPTFHAPSPCSDSAGCVGWVMSTTWKMAVSQSTFSMEYWHLEGEPKDAHSCATRMSARET